MTRTLLVLAGLVSLSAELCNVTLSSQAQPLVMTLIEKKRGTTVCVRDSKASCVAAKNAGAASMSCGGTAQRGGCADGYVAVQVAEAPGR